MKNLNKPILELVAYRNKGDKSFSLEMSLGGNVIEFSQVLAEAVISVGESMCEGKSDNKLVHIQAGVVFLQHVFEDIKFISGKVLDSMDAEEALKATIEAMSFRPNGQPSCPDENCQDCPVVSLCNPRGESSSTEPIQTTQENKNVQ